MQVLHSNEKIIRYTLGSLLGLLALNAFGGGYYGMAGAENVPVAWLQGSPFRSYFIPGLFLFAIVGGSAFVASIAVFSKRPMARRLAFFCTGVVVLWLIAQLSIIGYVSWMQPVTAITAVAIFLLDWLLPDKGKNQEA